MANNYVLRQRKRNVISSCGLCGGIDNDRMVQCDGCDIWYHFDCVNLKSITEEESWFCPSCVETQKAVIETSNRLQGTEQNEDEMLQNNTLCSNNNIVIPPDTHKRIIINEILLNSLRADPVQNQPTFDHTMFDRYTTADNFNTQETSQREFMTRRQFSGICSRTQLFHNTSAIQLNRQLNRSKNESDQAQSQFDRQSNRIQGSIYYRSQLRPDPLINRTQISTPSQPQLQPESQFDRTQSFNHGQTQHRYDGQSNRDSIHSPTQFLSNRRFEQKLRTQPEVESSTKSMSTSRRIQIELQKLEEESQAHKRYIDLKYRILLQDCERKESTDRKNYTEDWVNDINEDRNDDFNRDSQFTDEFVPERKYHAAPDRTSTPTEYRQITPETRSINPQTTNKVKFTAPPRKQTETEFTHLADLPRRTNVDLPPNFISTTTQNQSQILDKNQIAARHVVTRDLPTFNGNPEDWPLFYSRYRNSTELCGYSNAENLDRLQKCLKGRALEAVRHRLLMPESLPQVISTLQMLFGRPEYIVNNLINKVSQLAQPNMDKLETIVDFAMSVQNLSSTIETADLYQHLSNPTLINGLVNKLPVHIRLDWARFKAQQPVVTLSTLANWLYSLAEVVATVSEPIFTTSDDKGRSNRNPKKSTEIQKKKPEYFNAHQESKKVELQSKPKDEKEFKPSCNQNQNRSCIICQRNCPSVVECSVFASYSIDQRWKMVNNKKLCRTCLRLHFGFCRLNKSCGVNNCIRKHHPLLHDEERIKKQNSENRKETSTNELNSFHSPIKSNHRVLLRIVPVKLHANGHSTNTFAFLDDGSTTSLIDQRIVNKLNIKGTPKELCLLWSGTIHRLEKNSHEINVGISSIYKNSTIYQLKGVKTVETLGIPAQRLVKEEICQRFPYLRHVPFEDYEVGIPEILIGSNNPKIGIPTRIVEDSASGPIASETRMGWTIHGPTCKSDYPMCSSNVHMVEECKGDYDHDKNLHQYVKDYFSVENFGVRIDNFMNKESKDNERALEQMKTLTRIVEGGYECGLLWKYDQFELPDSYGMALRRLQCLEKRHPETIDAINSKIVEYVKRGYVTKLSEEEIRQNSTRKWYLPIFAVTYPKKPDKIRTVFDAAAKVNGVSLNSLLLKGPDQLVSMIDILRRFREKSIAAGGDIREMFHQIKTRKEDKNCQRFLWRNAENRKPDVYIMNVMTFGATCSPSIAHYVKNFNASKFIDRYPQAVETITKNHYVDDMMETAHTDEEMIKLINDVKMIHLEGGFEIRNFLSNSKTVMAAIGNGTDRKDKKIVPEKDINIERVLGMWWNIDIDCFTFSLKYTPVNKDILLGTKLPTKRELLRLLMSIFDPLGLIAHFLIHLKIIIQEIWRSNLHWDQQISDNKIVNLWKRWLELLHKVEDTKIPRLYTAKLSPNTSTSIELHVFVDASEEAFGAVCFLRVEDKEGVDCSLVGSKTRVAPIKYLSIPRKELQAAVLGTRLSSSIHSSQTFVVHRRIFWSDSKTVLSWLRSDHRKYHQFVAHRVGEILESTEQDEWRWIPTKINVADKLTKWTKSPPFETSSSWFSGPNFLKSPESEWPTSQVEINETEEEMKLNFAHSEIIVVRLFDPKRFSNWNRMIRALAYVCRYVRKLKSKIHKTTFPRSHLNQEELVKATNIIIRQAQFDEYPEEITTLTLNKDLQSDQKKFISKTSSIYLCSPYLDENGILRIRGRIDMAENVHHDTKRPIILPRHNHITKLLIQCYHRLYHHRYNETVVNELRQKYYIPKLRVVLKSVIKHECQDCKNRKAEPENPEMASLPFGRLAVGFRPFTHTGVDFFGPMEVVIGRRLEKRWGSLFTCLTVRAVHIEIAHSVNTDSFIKCLRNFISLRGRPNEMYSDQGTNFIGADNVMLQKIAEIDFDKVAENFTTSYSKWNFNPPHAQHFGGAWERLVRSVKTSLYAIMPTRRPDDETFRNLLMEVQNVINSRPLTFIPLDYDNAEALTPNHFLIGSSNGNKPPGVFESNGPILRSAWQENQRLTDLFWRRFVKEYLPTLTRRTKWLQAVKPLQIGDIGIDFDNNYPRNCYPKVRIIDKTMDSTGQVRRVRVQFANKSILWRPASKVARLDVLSKDGIIEADSKLTTQKVSLEESLIAAKPSIETEGNVAKPRLSERIALKKKSTNNQTLTIN